jgi:Fe2+ transport system protein FeoA
MHGTADRTSGGLTRKDLKMNKWGRIVSRAKSSKAKKENRLAKMGFKTQKGKFGVVKTGKKTRRGGMLDY